MGRGERAANRISQSDTASGEVTMLGPSFALLLILLIVLPVVAVALYMILMRRRERDVDPSEERP